MDDGRQKAGNYFRGGRFKEELGYNFKRAVEGDLEDFQEMLIRGDH